MFGSNSQVIVNYSRLPGFDTENERYKSIEAEKTQQKERQSCKSTAFYVLVVLIFTGLFVVVTLESHKRPLPPSQTCQSIEVRPEWRTLSDQEKSAYLKAVQCLRTVPSRLGLTQSLFDDFPYFHTRTGQAAHYTAAFLSWHRWFLHIYKEALQQSCGYNYQFPYWDWTLDWEDLTSAPIWSSRLGFGGNGNASDKFGFRGFCVTDGPFAYLNVSFIGVMEKPHCLSRGFLAGDALASWSQRIRPTAIATLFESQDYVNFSLAIERGPHPTIPHVVHGDFSVPTALQDPVWYLVHGEYDKLWWEWQEVNRKRLEDYGGRFMDGAVEKTASLDDQLQFGGLSPDVKVLKVINTTAWPLCYKY